MARQREKLTVEIEPDLRKSLARWAEEEGRPVGNVRIPPSAPNKPFYIDYLCRPRPIPVPNLSGAWQPAGNRVT
jgi:hypothetical protein